MAVVAKSKQPYSGFSPRDIPNCALWLDAADSSTLTLSGSNVTQWSDKSGNGNNFSQSSAGRYPVYTQNAINNLASISFTGAGTSGASTQVLDNSGIAISNTAYSILCVARANASQPSFSGYNYILKGSITNDGYLFFGNNPSKYFTTLAGTSTWNDVNANSPAITVTSTTLLLGMTISGSVLAPYYNGNAMTTKNGTTGAYSGMRIGDAPDPIGFPGQNWNGLISEILIYNIALSTTQRRQLEGYLAQKWGLKSSIPTAHPYKLIKPVTRGFQPTDIPNCALWLDAADATTLTLSGSNITQWNDKSGNGNNATQTTASLSPTYSSTAFNTSYPGLVFTPTVNTPGYTTTPTGIQFMRFPNIQGGTNDVTCFAVWQASDVSVKRNILANYKNQYNQFYGIYASRFEATSATTFQLQLVSGLNTTSPRIGSLILTTGTTNTLLGGINGTYLSNTSNVTPASSTVDNDPVGHIGIYNELEGYYGDAFKGAISEILIFTRAVSVTERQQLEGYLAQKWGLRANIPTTHPYKSILSASTLFLPTDITGCALWLDAADSSSLTLSGSNVTQWNDKSGNGFNFSQPTSSNYPVYNGSNGLTFTGNGTASSTQFLDNASIQISNSAYSVIVVARGNASQPSGNGYNYLIKGNRSADGFLFLGNNPSKFFATFTGAPTWNDTAANSPNISVTNNTLIMEMIVSGSTLTPYYTGNVMSTKTGTTGAFTGIRIGDAQVSGYTWNGSVYEIIMFNSALTTSQRQQIEGYLAHKWGLRANLPSTHPYKKFRP